MDVERSRGPFINESLHARRVDAFILSVDVSAVKVPLHLRQSVKRSLQVAASSSRQYFKVYGKRLKPFADWEVAG